MVLTWATASMITMVLANASGGSPDRVQESDLSYPYWPEFRIPQTILRSRSIHGMESAEVFLLESLSGLAAMAVNEGTGEEMLWVAYPFPDYRLWLSATAERIGARMEEPMDSWNLVRRFRDLGVVKGYVLYRENRTDRGMYLPEPDFTEGGNFSANVATTLCGILGGVLIEEKLEDKAIGEGLSLLADARDINPQAFFEEYKDRMDSRWVFWLDPKAPHMRGLAVSTRSHVGYGLGPDVVRAASWAEAGRPVIGWNCTDEFSHTLLATESGRFNTASNWSSNFPILSCPGPDSGTRINPKSTAVPEDIVDDPGKSYVSFVMSDGDNVQWLLMNFFHQPAYWANPHRGSFPFTWTLCAADLDQVAPPALAYLAGTETSNDYGILYGGGYFYPDRMDEILLKAHMRRLDPVMERLNIRVLGFLLADQDATLHREAMERVAGVMSSLEGLLTVRYYPYTYGNGAIDWVETRDGRMIPAVTAKWALWADLEIERNGSPIEIAEAINAWAEDNRQRNASIEERHAWCVVHAWSEFESPHDPLSRSRGFSPVAWCVERLSSDVEVVTAHELVVRLSRERVGNK